MSEFDAGAFEFKPDHTFAFSGGSGGLKTEIAGDYSDQGNQLTLTATKMQMTSSDPQLQAIIDSSKSKAESQLNHPIAEPIAWKSGDEFTMQSTSGWLRVGDSSVTFMRMK